MAITITRDALRLSDTQTNPSRFKLTTHWYAGDSSQTIFSLPAGHKPFAVYVNGSRYRDGALEDYVVTYDGFTYSVTFSVAPAVVDIAIDCEVIL